VAWIFNRGFKSEVVIQSDFAAALISAAKKLNNSKSVSDSLGEYNSN
jgi:hypothetical protein